MATNELISEKRKTDLDINKSKKYQDKRICACDKKLTASFGLLDSTLRVWCSKCPDKPHDAINIVSKKCLCEKRASLTFGLEGDKRPTWCSKCPNRPEYAINIKSKRCPCDKKAQPSFGLKGDEKPTWCYQCPDKPLDAIDIKHKKCSCMKKAQPKFGLAGDRKATWCAQCPNKSPDAIDIKNKKCPCNRKARPTFGREGDKKPTWCSKCPNKHPNAIDIKHKKCLCERKAQPSFGMEGDTRPTWCFYCPNKDSNAIDIKDKKCPCDKRAKPHFGMKGDKKPTWCFHCPDKPQEAINIVNRTCKSEWCNTQVSNIKYQRYCLRCFVHLFPDNKITRNYKTKETIVRNFIKELLEANTEFKHLEYRYDKPINGGCSKREPDFMIDCLTHVVVIEIDENGHDKEAYCSCENKRMCEIWNDIGNRPIVFLRFNPDAYVDSQGTKQQSCFGYDKRGFARVKPTYQKVWKSRLDILAERIKHHITSESTKDMEIEHLFYNGFHAI